MRVLLIKGRSQYNALRIFLDDAKVAFEALGHEVVTLDLANEEAAASFVELVQKLGPFDLAFSYNIMGDFVAPSGQNLGQLINAPQIIQYLDHPFSHLDRVKKTPRNAAVLLVDESHVDVVKAVFGADHFAYVGFNPHAGIGEPVALPDDAEAYAQSRPIRFLFAGTYYRPDPDNPPWKPMPDNIQVVFKDAADLAMAHDWFPPHLALIEALAARGIGAQDPTTIALMPYCNLVHESVRRERRYQFLKTAAKIKLPLTLCGTGFDKDLYRYKCMDYRGPADFHEVVALMRQSRMVMNVNVNFCQGSHERPLTAMLAGAVCASEPSTFYDANFSIGQVSGDMTYFKWSSLEDDLLRLRDLAEDPQALFDMALSAQRKAVERHTWKSRAERIIEVARAVREAPQWAE